MDNNTPIDFLSVSPIYVRGALNILIDDAYISLNIPKYGDIAWIDTAVEVDMHRVSRQCEIWTCSNKDKAQLERLGLKVSKVIPRPFNMLAYSLRNIPMGKKYDVFICGWYREPDRKNFRYMGELIEKLKLRCVAITNYPLPNRYDFATVDDYTKYMLIKQSRYVLHLAGNEGFGLPPLEGLAVGVPAIYLNAPAVNEWAVGYPIRPQTWVTSRIQVSYFNCNMRYAIPDMKDAIEVTRYALEQSEEQYYDMSLKAMEKADAMHKQVLDALRKIIM